MKSQNHMANLFRLFSIRVSSFQWKIESIWCMDRLSQNNMALQMHMKDVHRRPHHRACHCTPLHHPSRPVVYTDHERNEWNAGLWNSRLETTLLPLTLQVSFPWKWAQSQLSNGTFGWCLSICALIGLQSTTGSLTHWSSFGLMLFTGEEKRQTSIVITYQENI